MIVHCLNLLLHKDINTHKNNKVADSYFMIVNDNVTTILCSIMLSTIHESYQCLVIADTQHYISSC